jgi:hypothetical protein
MLMGGREGLHSEGGSDCESFLYGASSFQAKRTCCVRMPIMGECLTPSSLSGSREAN